MIISVSVVFAVAGCSAGNGGIPDGAARMLTVAEYEHENAFRVERISSDGSQRAGKWLDHAVHGIVAGNVAYGVEDHGWELRVRMWRLAYRSGDSRNSAAAQ